MLQLDKIKTIDIKDYKTFKDCVEDVKKFYQAGWVIILGEITMCRWEADADGFDTY